MRYQYDCKKPVGDLSSYTKQLNLSREYIVRVTCYLSRIGRSFPEEKNSITIRTIENECMKKGLFKNTIESINETLSNTSLTAFPRFVRHVDGQISYRFDNPTTIYDLTHDKCSDIRIKQQITNSVPDFSPLFSRTATRSEKKKAGKIIAYLKVSDEPSWIAVNTRLYRIWNLQDNIESVDFIRYSEGLRKRYELVFKIRETKRKVLPNNTVSVYICGLRSRDKIICGYSYSDFVNEEIVLPREIYNTVIFSEKLKYKVKDVCKEIKSVLKNTKKSDLTEDLIEIATNKMSKYAVLNRLEKAINCSKIKNDALLYELLNSYYRTLKRNVFQDDDVRRKCYRKKLNFYNTVISKLKRKHGRCILVHGQTENTLKDIVSPSIFVSALKNSGMEIVHRVPEKDKCPLCGNKDTGCSYCSSYKHKHVLTRKV